MTVTIKAFEPAYTISSLCEQAWFPWRDLKHAKTKIKEMNVKIHNKNIVMTDELLEAMLDDGHEFSQVTTDFEI